MYEQKTLKSGATVNIRPIGWEEFWEIGNLRINAADKKDDAKALFAAGRDIRERTLSLCVQDWDKLKTELSLPEVLEIESIIDEISRVPIAEGNS